MTDKVIKGFENYTVDRDGNVFSLKKQQYMQPTRSHKNQIIVQLYKDGKVWPQLVHRLVAKTYLTNLKDYPYVRHLDGDMDNNNVYNLCWSNSNKHYSGEK